MYVCLYVYERECVSVRACATGLIFELSVYFLWSGAGMCVCILAPVDFSLLILR